MRLSNPAETFKKLAREVHGTKTEKAAVSAILRTLMALGASKADAQNVTTYETKYQGYVLRVYVWWKTPYDQEVILATGPNFESKVILTSQIDPSNGVGLFIHGIVRDKPPSSLATMTTTTTRAEQRQVSAKRGTGRRSVEVEEATPSASASAARAVRSAEKAADAVEKAERSGGRRVSRSSVLQFAERSAKAAEAAARAEADAKAAEARAKQEAAEAAARAERVAAEARRQKESETAKAADDAKEMMKGFLDFLETI